MKKIFLIILLFVSLTFAENYKKVKIFISDKSEIVELHKIGLPLDDAYQNRDGSIDIFLNELEFKALQRSSFNYNILIDDWDQYYVAQREKSIETSQLPQTESLYNVSGFSYGSMGGYYTLEEVWRKIDEMITNYPNLISVKDSIGTTIEGRTIYAVRISDNPNVDEEEPEVLYTALHHAREPESMMQMIYFMFYLLENYGTDSEVTYLVDNREMYFIPVVNPDGYYYNQFTNPNGGGMWRKNRRLNDDGSYGIDLNRNYGYKWAYDDEGSSGVPSSNTYRGISPFSEPETETISQFCIAHNFRLALNYHTYSNLLITPWGYIPQATPDSLFYSEIASDMTKYNNYEWGYSSDIIYSVNGDSDDWFYGEQTEKNKIFAMTPEVGNSSDGFWPIVDRIVPLAEENVYPNLYLAWVAGGFINTLNFDYDKEYYSAGDTGYVDLTLKNKGLESLNNVKVIVNIAKNGELLSNNIFEIAEIAERTDTTFKQAVKFKVEDTALAADTLWFNLEYYLSDLLISSDKYYLIIGEPKTLYIDSLNTLDNWRVSSNVSKNWEITTGTFYSESSSVTDSKIGDYLASSTVELISKTPIDLTLTSAPYLQFKTKYNIETDWDYGQVLVSADSSVWQAVGGENAEPGVGSFQPTNVPVYDGIQNNWVNEVININEFAGKKIYLKFVLKTDEYVQEDGWYVDDVEIFEYSNAIVSVKSIPQNLPIVFRLEQNYPNPFNPSTTIQYSIPSNLLAGDKREMANVKLIVYDILGRVVATLVNKEQSPGNYQVKFDASHLATGLYFYSLKAGNFVDVKKMILLK